MAWGRHCMRHTDACALSFLFGCSQHRAPNETIITATHATTVSPFQGFLYKKIKFYLFSYSQFEQIELVLQCCDWSGRNLHFWNNLEKKKGFCLAPFSIDRTTRQPQNSSRLFIFQIGNIVIITEERRLPLDLFLMVNPFFIFSKLPNQFLF